MSLKLLNGSDSLTGSVAGYLHLESLSTQVPRLLSSRILFPYAMYSVVCALPSVLLYLIDV